MLEETRQTEISHVQVISLVGPIIEQKCDA